MKCSMCIGPLSLSVWRRKSRLFCVLSGSAPFGDAPGDGGYDVIDMMILGVNEKNKV